MQSSNLIIHESYLKALRPSFLIQLKTVFINKDRWLASYCQMLGSMTYVASLEYLNEKSFLKKDFRKEIYACNVYYVMAAKAPIAGTGR